MKVQGYSNYQTNDSQKRSVSKGSSQDQTDNNPDTKSSKSKVENES